MSACIFGALLGVTVFLASSESESPQIDLEVEARASIERTEYQPMEPIWVRLDVKNETDYTWMVMSENPYRSISIEVEKDGESIDETAYGEEALGPRRYITEDGIEFRYFVGSTELVAPGHTFSFSGRRVLVNWVRDMTAPGEYTIRLSIPFFYDDEDDRIENGRHMHSRGIVRANTVTVRVSGRPRPPEGP